MHDETDPRATPPPPVVTGELSEGVGPQDAHGVGASALIAGGLFALPWLLALAVGLWADVQPANDLVVELYQPLEAVYLQLDPPADAPDDLGTLDEGEVAEEDLEGDPEVIDPPEPRQDLPADEGGSDGEDGGPAGDDVGDDGDGDGDDDEDGGEGEGEGAGAGDGSGDRKATPQRRKRRRSAKCVPDHPHVRSGSDGIMEVDRSLVEYYTASLSRFMELGYSEPYERDGIKGFYIGGFGCTSPVYKAGLRRGDMLITVNGKKTRTWVGVYLLYKKLRKQQEFEVKLLRRGKEGVQTLHFRVVD